MAFPLLGSPRPQFLDLNGDPIVGGTLSILDPSDDTNKATYPTAADADAATNANSNPMTLNSLGFPPTGLFGVDGEEYKIIVKDADEATIWNHTGIKLPEGLTQSAVGAVLQPTTAAENSAGVTPTNKVYPELHLLRYGANTTPGTTDMTTPLANAIAVAKQRSGEVFIPAGVYKANITATGTNWAIRGETHGFSSLATTVSIRPATTTDPVLSVGDGTNTADGISFYGIAFDGGEGGDEGVKINGATRIYFDHVTVRSFSEYQVYITSSATKSTSHIFWDNYQIGTSTDATSFGIKHEYGSSFATAIFFCNGSIGGQAGASYVIDLKSGVGGAQLRLLNTWITARDGAGIHLQDAFAKVYAANVIVDSGSSSDELVTCDFASTSVATLFPGNLQIDGVIGFTDGTTAELPDTGQFLSQAYLLNSFIQGSLLFQDGSSATEWYERHDSTITTPRIFRLGDQLTYEAIGKHDFRGDLLLKDVAGTGIGFIFFGSATGVAIRTGTGSPEGSVTAPVGSLFLRSDGGSSTTLYVKESGAGNTGWVAK